MLWLNPERVTIGAVELRGVIAVAVDREAARLTEEFSDLGPHVAFADVPEQRVMIRLTRELVESEGTLLRPGDQGALSFRASANASDVAGRTVSATVVVTGVGHTLGARSTARQVIVCVAISSDGAADPVSETAG